MHGPYRICLTLLCVCSGSIGAALPGLRYLGDIGDLGIPGNANTSVKFGRFQVVWNGDRILFQGHDDDAKRWRAVLPVAQGLGYTTVWQADFDHNSRQDLMIAAYFHQDGRCIDEVTLSFLLFDDHGRPIPWLTRTRMPYSHKFNSVPAIFTDLNHDGRAELVVTDCAYGDPQSLGEDRSITGIYEAKDAMWNLIRPTHLAPYVALVRQSYRLRSGVDRLLTPIPADWTDQGNRLEPNGSPPVQPIALLVPSEACRGPVHLPPVVNGQLLWGWKDPCDEIGHNRLQMSDGAVCYDWPTVVIDSDDGREIVADTERPETLLKKIIEQRRSVILAGQRDPKRCSPVMLWAFPTR
jgi:hypothetical protein